MDLKRKYGGNALKEMTTNGRPLSIQEPIKKQNVLFARARIKAYNYINSIPILFFLDSYYPYKQGKGRVGRPWAAPDRYPKPDQPRTISQSEDDI